MSSCKTLTPEMVRILTAARDGRLLLSYRPYRWRISGDEPPRPRDRKLCASRFLIETRWPGPFEPTFKELGEIPADLTDRGREALALRSPRIPRGGEQ